LVRTVNGLPGDYRGKCEILLNDADVVVVNRSLVIPYALLGSGPSIEESAELATHLIYSAALSVSSAEQLRRYIGTCAVRAAALHGMSEFPCGG